MTEIELLEKIKAAADQCVKEADEWFYDYVFSTSIEALQDVLMAQTYAQLLAKRIAAVLKRRADEPKPVGVISDEDIRAMRRGQ